jgi:hypothetical protein
MFRQAQFDHLCLQVGSSADCVGNRRMLLGMPEPVALVGVSSKGESSVLAGWG